MGRLYPVLTGVRERNVSNDIIESPLTGVCMPKAKVIKFATAVRTKQESTRAQRFARVEDHLQLLEINEFNFVAHSPDELDMLEPGKAWWHRVATVFGMSRLPTTEAELLGTQQALMFLVMASRPTPWAEQDADWLTAGRETIEESMAWATAWFEAYLEQDMQGMQQAMVDDYFIEAAALDWLETKAAQAGGSPELAAI